MEWNPYKKFGVMSEFPPFEPPKEEQPPEVVTDEFLESIPIVRDLHEENTGRKLTDDQFRTIIETLVVQHSNALENLRLLEDGILHALIALDDADRR